MARPRDMMRDWRFVVVVTLLAAGCGSPKGTSNAKPKGDSPPMRVAAASDLQTALPALVERFKAKTGMEVSITFGASGQLAAQIRQGAPFDLFLAANRGFVKALADENYVMPESVRDYAEGSLVLVVHRESASKVNALADLADPSIKKVAIANPALAPYGAAAKQAMERAKVWDAVRPKLAQAETVRQALQFVQSGNAEAALVGKAIADVPEVRVIAIDPALHDPIVQALGVVTASTHSQFAEDFARFVLGEEGRAILAKNGFGPAPGDKAKARPEGAIR